MGEIGALKSTGVYGVVAKQNHRLKSQQSNNRPARYSISQFTLACCERKEPFDVVDVTNTKSA
jgi:hypothetical protein